MRLIDDDDQHKKFEDSIARGGFSPRIVESKPQEYLDRLNDRANLIVGVKSFYRLSKSIGNDVLRLGSLFIDLVKFKLNSWFKIIDNFHIRLANVLVKGRDIEYRFYRDGQQISTFQLIDPKELDFTKLDLPYYLRTRNNIEVIGYGALVIGDYLVFSEPTIIRYEKYDVIRNRNDRKYTRFIINDIEYVRGDFYIAKVSYMDTKSREFFIKHNIKGFPDKEL